MGIRLGALLVASLLAITLITLVIEQTVHERRVRTDFQARYQLLSSQTFELMLLAMRQEAPASVDEILTMAADNPQIDHVRVLDTSGRVRHSSASAEIGQQTPLRNISGLKPGEVRVIRSEVGGRPVADALSPIANAPRCRACHPVGEVNGIMEVRLDAARAVQELQSNRIVVFFHVGLGVLLIFGVLWLLARRMVLRPLSELGASMKSVAGGDLSTQISLEAPAELREVAASFNEMTRHLKEARRQLEHHHQDDLVRADRLATVGELASTMAHEIQNPLAGLSGALQVFARDPAFAHRKEILEELDATVRRLSNTVRELLRFGRQSNPELQPTDLNELARMVALFLEQQLAGKGRIAIHTQLEEALPEVLLDPQQFRQVLLNLCLNAVQAMKEGGGELFIVTEAVEHPESPSGESGPPSGPGVRATVRDTGPGIEPERLELIFRPFYTTKIRGTGLGLAIARRIVEKVGGRLTLESEVGVGTTVRIDLLPRAVAEAKVANEGGLDTGEDS
ncbi:MAG: ATP-binding protein [Deltaproteobacteria bacterium]|nr:ATP-binding protein [Deltaproteobacteria bacterium]